MQEHTQFIGMDVHKETITVAVAPGEGGEVRPLGAIPATPDAVAQLMRRLGSPSQLVCCYEAGPCGYGLYRQLTELGISCQVVAPSLIPRKPGDRIKTDQRDAVKLARLLRSGDLTAVWVPAPADEALRDLTRAREHAQQVLTKARQTLRMFLLRLGCQPPSTMRPWRLPYWSWLRRLQLPQPAQQVVLDEYRTAVEEGEARVRRLDAAVGELAPVSSQAPLIAGLQTMRGVAMLTAATVVAELGDITRFSSPRQLMAYAGLVPSEASSGGRERRGGITKTGNAHLRHILVESAHQYRHTPAIGRNLRRRQEGQSAAVCAVSWQAQQRLHKRFRRLLARGKLVQQAVIAVARELLGFIWGLAQTLAQADPARQHAA